jgi:glutamyl-tRNA synthetase
VPLVKNILLTKGITTEDKELTVLIPMVKDRCQLLEDFYPQTAYFFEDPSSVDTATIQNKWDISKKSFFENWIQLLGSTQPWDAGTIETSFKELASSVGIKAGELQLPLRIMLVGGKFGPPVFEIASTIGKEATLRRISKSISLLS